MASLGLRTHALRTLLTGLAVLLGVGFLGGALLYADTARVGFYDDFSRHGLGVDVAVNPPDGYGYALDDPLTAQTLAAIRDVPGVDRVDGRTVARLPMIGTNGRVMTDDGAVGFAMSIPDPQLSPLRAVSGALPTASGEAALDRATAKRMLVTAGQRVTVIDPKGVPRTLTVTGIVDFGAGPIFSGGTVLILTRPDIVRLTGATGYSSIVVSAAAHVDPDELRSRIAGVVGAGVPVVTGDQLRHDLAQDGAKYVDGFLAVLFVSTLVALVVAVLVVYNTFTILVAQRTRMLALLRCVGASRAQLVRLVLTESSVIGLVASIAGLGLSFVTAKLIIVGRTMFGSTEPAHPLVVTPSSLITAVAVGTLSTMLAGLLPAFAASRVSPLAVLAATNDGAGPSRRPRAARARAALAVLLGLAGGYVMHRAPIGFPGAAQVAVGGMTIFVGLVIAMPVIVTPLTTAVGWLPSRLFGVSARLAVSNARRHPARVAATTTALMIGIALMSLFAVILATARVQADRELAENFPVDFELDAIPSGPTPNTLPPDLVRDLRTRSEFADVVRARHAFVDVSDTRVSVTAIDPTGPGDAGLAGVEVMQGSLGGLTPGTVVLHDRYADATVTSIGDTITLTSDDGDIPLRVVGIYDDAPVAGSDMIIGWSQFETEFGSGGDQVLIRDASAVDPTAAEATLDQVLRSYPLVAVTTKAERRAELTRTLDQRLTQFAALIGISTVIAVLGIMDTLALAVIERTRESATLRALGLSRHQLRGMLTVEAIVMAVAGAAMGVAFGVGVGWYLARSLIEVYGHGSPEVPIPSILGLVGLAAMAGIAASVLPARRATRAAVIAAMADS